MYKNEKTTAPHFTQGGAVHSQEETHFAPPV